MNKYKKWYDRIIKRAQSRVLEGYTESHHILPRSLGGVDNIDNLVELTAREHFICHILLTKFTKGADRNKMLHAVIIMKGKNKQQDRYINSKLYETARKAYAEKRSADQQGTGNSYYGKKHSAETRAKMSAAKKGKSVPWNKGKARTEEEKRNISLARKGQPSPKKGTQGKTWTDEQRIKMAEIYNSGAYFWWTNGVDNIRAQTPPNDSYRRGRTLSVSHRKALTK
jgi:hypothetical protein